VVTFTPCIFALPIKTGTVLRHNRQYILKNKLKKNQDYFKKDLAVKNIVPTFAPRYDK
jgi:hypothetical protein